MGWGVDKRWLEGSDGRIFIGMQKDGGGDFGII
jgi:hypothetical protein